MAMTQIGNSRTSVFNIIGKNSNANFVKMKIRVENIRKVENLLRLSVIAHRVNYKEFLHLK